MKTKCPHCQKILTVPDEYKGKQIKCGACHQVFVIKPIKEASELPISKQSSLPESNRTLWITAIIVATGLAWVIGFACGALLTRTNREETNAEIAAIQSEADIAIMEAQQIAEELQGEVRELRYELSKSEKGVQEVSRAKTRSSSRSKTRQEKIEEQFSVWNGSHRGLTKLIKESMNDPKSYQHVETRYVDKGDYLIVVTTFRGKNAFGGVVKNSVTAKVDLNGNVISIISQEP